MFNMQRDILTTVNELFSTRLMAPSIDNETPLVDYGLDSLRAAEIVIDLEQMFGIEISDEDAAQMHTVQQVVDAVTAKLERQGQPS